MLSVMAAMPLAASATPLRIVPAVSVCSSTAWAMVLWLPSMLRTVDAMRAMTSTTSRT